VGASEFTHEDHLSKTYRATFRCLGAMATIRQIRTTKDGVLVCFSDDMLDRCLAAYGDFIKSRG